MGRHRDFWGLTEDGLVFATNNLKLDLTPGNRKQLMDAYLKLAAFPDVKPGLEAHLVDDPVGDFCEEVDYLLHGPADGAGYLSFRLKVEPPAPTRRYNDTHQLADLIRTAQAIGE